MSQARLTGLVAVIVALASALALYGVHSTEAAKARAVAHDPSAARPAAVRFLQALAHGAPVSAMEAPAGLADTRSLAQLQAWVSRIPIADLRVTAYDATERAGRARVLVSMRATLGAPPSSVPIDMGERELELRPVGGLWLVAADASQSGDVVLPKTGLGAITGARYTLGRRAIVVDATGDPAGARLARDTADAYAPYLQHRYGGGRAIRRPVIFVLPDAASAQAVGDVSGFDEAVGEEKNGLVFINHPEWKQWSGPGQRGVVVHELTHVASRGMLVGAPESLVEGLARYEESLALNAFDWQFKFEHLDSAYRAGYPTAGRWHNTVDDLWGLTDESAISLAYLDGLAMTHAIIVHHGGIASVRALAAAYEDLAPDGNATPRQERQAFMRALGVPFSQVVGEAHAFARSQV